jgi:hypothetical protein
VGEFSKQDPGRKYGGAAMNEVIVGIIAASGGGAVTWLTTNARLRRELELLYDRDLREKRVAAYSELWRRTKRVPRNRRPGELTTATLREIREDWHDWYYDDGGIYMSEAVRIRYFEATAVIDGVRDASSEGELEEEAYLRVYTAVKRLRDVLTDDIGLRLDQKLGGRSARRPPHSG